jgi:hypothetical protein
LPVAGASIELDSLLCSVIGIGMLQSLLPSTEAIAIGALRSDERCTVQAPQSMSSMTFDAQCLHPFKDTTDHSLSQLNDEGDML